MSRFLDLLLSLVALLLLSPLLVIVGAVNGICTGRILFKQVRVGRALKPFTILKFQTMVDAAPGGSTVTVGNDARLTGFGRVLRACKLDELPQLINVVRGEMSLVGPRALTPNEIARIPVADAAHVYSVRPGMTGLSSLLYADEERLLAAATWPEEEYFSVILPRKIALESVYVSRKNLWFDGVMLGLTPLAIVFPDLTRTYLLRIMEQKGHLQTDA